MLRIVGRTVRLPICLYQLNPLRNLSAGLQVLATKDWTKWDWDVVDDIVQDTLPHPPRLVDALRTKWIKRVSGFYRFVGAGNSGTSTDR